MKIRDLTLEEIELLDPSGRARAMLAGMCDGKPTPVPSFLTIQDRDRWLVDYIALRNKYRSQHHPEVMAYDEEMVSKFGPQGASFSLEDVQKVYESSYTLAQRKIFPRIALRGRDLLIRYVQHCIEQFGYPQLAARSMYATSASLPTMLKKGTYYAETVGMAPYRHVVPMLPGQRNQRKKKRVINQDPVANVRLFEREINAARYWLREHLPQFFGAWLNPMVDTLPRITRSMLSGRFFSVEADYSACDEHFSLDLVQQCVLPIYEVLFPDKTVFHEFSAYVEELFYQPLFFGTYLWTGLHNLFSGQNITQDFETIFDVCLQLGAVRSVGLVESDVTMLAIGDDQSVITHDGKRAERLLACIIEEANLCGMDMALPKCRLSSESVRFCRKVYAPSLPKAFDQYGRQLIMGAYPAVLALNNIVNPERGTPSLAEAVKACVQRMDVVFGNQLFAPFTQFVWKRVRKQVTDQQIEEAPSHDWWERVYGEVWHLCQSPSYKFLRQCNMW